jgi:hypothetical protein
MHADLGECVRSHRQAHDDHPRFSAPHDHHQGQRCRVIPVPGHVSGNPGRRVCRCWAQPAVPGDRGACRTGRGGLLTSLRRTCRHRAAGSRRQAARGPPGTAGGTAGDLEEALAAIEQAGRAALADLRRLVTLMRSDPAEGPGDSDPAEPARAFAADLTGQAGPA